MKNLFRIIKEILERDSYSVNDEDYESQTALHLACMHGHFNVVSVLIKAMADIHARNCYLWTPLDCAAAYGWAKCAQLLIKVRVLRISYVVYRHYTSTSDRLEHRLIS